MRKCRSNWNNWNHRTRVEREKKREEGERCNNAWHSGHILSGRTPAERSHFLAWDWWFAIFTAYCNRWNCFVSLNLPSPCHHVWIIGKFRNVDFFIFWFELKQINCNNRFSTKKCCGTVNAASEWLVIRGGFLPFIFWQQKKILSCDFFSPFFLLFETLRNCFIVERKNKEFWIRKQSTMVYLSIFFSSRIHLKLLMLWWFNYDSPATFLCAFCGWRLRNQCFQGVGNFANLVSLWT